MGRVVQQDVIRHETVRGVALDDRVANVSRLQFVAVVQLRLRVVEVDARLGEARQRIEAGERARCVLDAGGFRRDSAAEFLEQHQLARLDPFVGT